MYEDLKKVMFDIIMTQTEEMKDWLQSQVVRDLERKLGDDRVRSNRDSVASKEDLWVR